ncbi:hypothetical protein R6Q57_009568, partial [Mikania cordata]
FEGWVETKCSSCIDGRLEPPSWQETVVVVVASSRSNVAKSPEMMTGEEPRQ